jgi:hypothetical protein
MPRELVLAVIVASASLQACSFFVIPIPGSVTRKVSDLVTGDKGANCVSTSTKVGDQKRELDGSIATVKSLSGVSQRCTDVRYPIRAELEVVPDTVAEGAPPSAFASPIHFKLSDGWQAEPLADAEFKRGWYAKAQNSHKDAIATLSARTHEGITDMTAYMKMRKADVLGVLADPVVVEDVHEVEINGHPAYRYVVKGTADNGKAVALVGTVIEGPKDIAIITATTYATNFDGRKVAMEQIAGQVVGFR